VSSRRPEQGEESAALIRRRRRDSFAMVARSVIRSDLDDACIRLLACLDDVQGERGWPAKGADVIAGWLGWAPRKVTTHARHLETAGVIEFSRADRGRHSYRVIHNPARVGRVNPGAQVGDPKLMYRKPSKYGAKRSQGDPLQQRGAVSRADPRQPPVDHPRQPRVEARDRRGMNGGDCPADTAGHPRSERYEGGLRSPAVRETAQADAGWIPRLLTTFTDDNGQQLSIACARCNGYLKPSAGRSLSEMCRCNF
jgi:hypothetical protein